MKDQAGDLALDVQQDFPDEWDDWIGDLVENFGFYAIEVVRLFRRCFDFDLAETELNLSPGEARALSFAAAFPNLRQKQLAERMGVEPMTLVGYIDSLSGKGLVARVADPGDRRANIIMLTDDALSVVGKLAALNRQIRDSAVQSFSAGDVVALTDLLVRLREAFSTIEAERRSTTAQGRRPAALADPPTSGKASR